MTYIDALLRRVSLQQEHRIHIRTGWPRLDANIRGLHPGKLYVVAGRPGAGKTSFATTMTAGILRSNESVQVLYFSTELEVWEIKDQMVEANAGGIAIFPNGRECKEHEKEALMKSGERVEYWWNQGWLQIHHEKKLTTEAIAATALAKIDDFENVVIIVDQANRIGRDDANGRRSYSIATENMLNDFEQMTMDMDIPIVLLTQANRETEGKRPTMANIKHSGAFEEYAHCVMLLHRPNPNQSAFTEDEIILAKNRHGRTGLIEASFIGESHTWTVVEHD